MKKTFTIEVDIDTDLAGETKADAPRSDTSKWRVLVRSNLAEFGPVNSQSIACAVAHEIGHVIGFQCDLSSNAADPRFGPRAPSAGLSYGELVLNSEKEAWEMAEHVFSTIKKRAMKTYEDEHEKTALSIFSIRPGHSR